MSVTVVSGLIINDDGEILMALRHKDNPYHPDMWEIPGGKVEGGETERDALIRELNEELGVAILIGGIVSTASYLWDGKRHNMLLYSVRLICREEKPLASQRLLWEDPAVARTSLPCLPTFYSWFPDILEASIKTKDAPPYE